MSIRFVLGRPGTGKTALCLREISEHISQSTALYYLVPEQFSLQSEKLLTRFSQAYTQVQALSFNRLAYQLFAKLGGPPGKIVDETGRHMLLRKIVAECGDGLGYYGRSADKQGFIDGLARTVAELNRYNIEPSDLLTRSEGAAAANSPALAAKLKDLSLILNQYRLTVTGRYLLTDETLTLLHQRLTDVSPLAGSHFWIDGFSGFTPQERAVLGHILQTANSVTVTLTLRAPSDPFGETTRETRRVLTELAQSLQVPVTQAQQLETDFRHKNQPALSFFTARLGTAAVWHENPQGIEVISAPGRHAVVYEAARCVWTWVRERGYRFQDIAVLCDDRAAYEKLLRNAFGRLNIPLFIDSRPDILSHPLTELVRAAVEVAARNWTYESVFRFLKTRMTPLTQDEVDKLENFVLARGIKGYYWRYPFVREESENDPAAIEAEAARVKTLAALAPFTDKLRPDKKETVSVFCHRIFDLLYALRVPETLTEYHSERISAGDQETARMHKQLWPKLCEIFDKLVEILGSERVTVKEFAQILEAGLTQSDLGLIPPAVDQVLLGDIGRSRFPAIKGLMVLGANEGRLPPPSAAAGLFTDDERTRLRTSGMELAPDISHRVNEDMFSLYCGLSQPREQLTLLHDENEAPARILKQIRRLFPALEERRALPIAEYPPRAFDLPEKALSPLSTGRLYGDTVITAASRLERFAECPFAYYVRHNLKAGERKIYQVGAADLGVVFHEVLAEFSRQLTEENIPWGSLKRDEIRQRVDVCVESAVPEETHVLRGSARNRYVLRRVKRICEASVWALSEHIRRGSFTPVGFELDFKPDSPVTTLEIWLDNQRRMILTGRIDRVDILRAEENTCYVKIIDYKSGAKKFDLSEVLRGTQLQLILYMNALLKNGSALFGEQNVALEARPGGMFYFHIGEPLLDTDDRPSPEEREELLLKCFRMSGLALADTDIAAGMDEGLREKGESPIIPVSVKRSGEFSKSSSVADLEGFALLGQQVEEKVKELGLRMTEGVIEPMPLVDKHKKRSACDFCRYSAICGHGVLH